MRFGHIELPVRDPLASLAFYVERLGFELVANQGQRFVWVRMGEVEILLRPGPPRPAGALDETTNLVLYTDRLEETVADLRSRGLTLERRGSCYLLEDPDGHWIQVVDPTDDHSA